MSSGNTISIETDAHVIEICEGWLTIGTKEFPDDCVSLTPQEAEEVLKALLQCGTPTPLDHHRRG